MTISIGRRKLITALGGAAVVWPRAVRAQQEERIRRIGFLSAFGETDPNGVSWNAAFVHGLGEAGWIEGRNLHIDYRWANADIGRVGPLAKELVALSPEVILSVTTPATAALKRETSTIPIVFAIVSDPVGAGFVASLAQPGGNITGFIDLEGSVGGKWLDLLKEAAPNVVRAAIMFNPDTAPGHGGYFLPSFEKAGKALGVTTSTAPVHNPAEIEKAVSDLAKEPGGGLVLMGDSFNAVHRKQVMALAETYKLPVIYPSALYANEGGLLGYSPVYVDLFTHAATYVDRILKGESLSELPVQVPTKFNLTINLKTAKALGLTVPPMLLTIADEVIE